MTGLDRFRRAGAAAAGMVALLLGGAATAEEPWAASGQKGEFILALEDGHATAKADEIDVGKHGGTLLGARGRYRFIELPLSAARALCADHRVAFLQRVWKGEPVESRGEAPCPSSKYDSRTGPNSVETDLTWETGTYLYDGSGNIRTIGADTYAYDSAGRLITAKVKEITENYRYDSFGNLTEKSIAGATATPIGVDSSSNRLAGISYDVAGNVESRGRNVHRYDSAGMLDTIHEQTNSVRFLYTADDERIVTLRDSSTARTVIRDFQGRVLREFSSSGYLNGLDRWVWEQDHIYAGGQVIAADREARYGGKRHFHLDHLGSVRMITNDARLRLGIHDYYPFGLERTSPVQEVTNFGYDRPSATKFTGHERDFRWLNADHIDYLDYMHARYYDPGLGRFLSVDPAPDSVSLAMPQTWNRYSYALNNPINLTDPNGMKPCKVTLKGADAKAAGVESGTQVDGECVEAKAPRLGLFEIRFPYLENALRNRFPAEPSRPSPQAQPPNKQQCAHINDFLNAEAKHGTVAASTQYSNTIGRGYLPGFYNDAGGVYRNIVMSNGDELDVDWLLNLQMARGATGGPVAAAYAGGKTAWSLGKAAMGQKTGYPLPFTDPGEVTALRYVSEGRALRDVFTPHFMENACQ